MNTTSKPITVDEIQLKPWAGKFGRIAGGREVHIRGEIWALVRMEGHGPRKPTFELYHPSVGEAGHTSGAVFIGKFKDRVHAKTRSLDEIPAKVLEAIQAGALKSPAVRRAEAERENRKFAAAQAAEEARQARMRGALISVSRRTDLTVAEWVGLRDAFKDIFHSNIPEDDSQADSATALRDAASHPSAAEGEAS